MLRARLLSLALADCAVPAVPAASLHVPRYGCLRPERDLRQLMAFAPVSTFWVMIFQDNHPPQHRARPGSGRPALARTAPDRRIEATPGWRSDVTDDHTPFEFSVALEEGHPELRFLVEVQADPVTDLKRSWDAGRRANEDLRRKHGVSLETISPHRGLFAPEDPTASVSLWHAVCLAVGEAPEFKVYLNPRSRGLDQITKVVRGALHRLGFRSSRDVAPAARVMAQSSCAGLPPRSMTRSPGRIRS